MKKRQTLLLLAVVVTMLLSFSVAVSAASFTDISGHWAESQITEWGEYGIIQGDGNGTFRPNAAITRGEMAVIIDRLFTYTEKTNNIYNDLEDRQWYTDPILRLTAAGVMFGYQGNVRPHDTIRREEAVSMIGRACHINEANMALSYADGDKVSSWAKGMVGSMTILQYISGYNNYFSPQNPMSRAEAITIFHNMKTKGALVLPGESEPSKTVAMGIDVSYHNGIIDWEKIAASDVDFVMIRVGNRGYGEKGAIQLDPMFKRNIEAASAAGLDIGIYFFSQAITVDEAKEEAEYVIEQIAPYHGSINYPVVFDWENISDDDARTDDLYNNKNKDTVTSEAKIFCDIIETNGYIPMIYFNRDLGLNLYHLSRLTQYDFWYAYYGSQPSFSYDYKMLQYSDKGKVNGVIGDVDMNLSYQFYAPKSFAQQVRALQKGN